jgi:hypothetical protein
VKEAAANAVQILPRARRDAVALSACGGGKVCCLSGTQSLSAFAGFDLYELKLICVSPSQASRLN